MRVCDHDFEYNKSWNGVTNFGRNFVVGFVRFYRCSKCGKSRSRVIGPRVVIKNPYYGQKQLELW